MPAAYLRAPPVDHFPPRLQPAGCRGKRIYHTRDGAEAARLSILAKPVIEPALNVYHCSHCGLFHMGRRVRG